MATTDITIEGNLLIINVTGIRQLSPEFQVLVNKLHLEWVNYRSPNTNKVSGY